LMESRICLIVSCDESVGIVFLGYSRRLS
jgi:hypothetical protein